ncbi:MAG: hypothetical protein ACM3SY_11995 [Candidatus Omnitrophota bacterium]
MQEVVKKIRQTDQYSVAMISMQTAKNKTSEEKVLEIFLRKMSQAFRIEFPRMDSISDIASLFTRQYFQKPVILIIDEFDSLNEEFINSFADVFRDINHAPRRSDQRVYEAVFHFSIYAYLNEFLRSKKANVLPEFPTGNGKIDILIQYRDQQYEIELKSFRDSAAYKSALGQTAQYGKHLGLSEIFLVSFIESIDEKTRGMYETVYQDSQWGVTVKPFFIQTGRI